MNNQVTVIIPAKVDTPEQLTWLYRAIDSAHRNDCRAIVVDDVSTMDFESTVRFDIGNQGPAFTRNKALEFVETEFVVPLDADDEFLPGAINALLGAHQENSITYGDVFIDGVRVRQRPTDIATLLCGMSVPAVTALYSVELLQSVGGWPVHWRNGFEDVALWAKLLASDVRANYISVPIFSYNKRDDSVSARMDTGALWAHLRAAYPNEWQRAQMCGCGSRKTKQYKEALADMVIDNPVVIAYTGTRDTSFGYRGPTTGKRYHVNPDQELIIESADRTLMLATGLFIDAPLDVGEPAEFRSEVWSYTIDGA